MQAFSELLLKSGASKEAFPDSDKVLQQLRQHITERVVGAHTWSEDIRTHLSVMQQNAMQDTEITTDQAWRAACDYMDKSLGVYQHSVGLSFLVCSCPCNVC